MIQQKREVVSILFFLVLCLGFGRDVFAASLSITPVIIDEKAMARDILKETITIANTTGRKVTVYTFVNNVSIGEGKQQFLDPSRADQSSSLANWIMIRRGGIELSPGEKKQVDFNIEVNLHALPGMYHAVISFAEASTRDEALARVSNAPTLNVNLEVREDIQERLELRGFAPDHIFFSSFPVSFSYALENVGNRPLSPSGEIRIYDRRGREVTTLPVNATSSSITPSASLSLTNIWQGPKIENRLLAAVGSGFTGMGRYKALLDLEFGSKERRSFQDTVFFWVIPWPLLVSFLGVLLAVASTVAYFLHRQYERRIHRVHAQVHREATGRKVVDLRRP